MEHQKEWRDLSQKQFSDQYGKGKRLFKRKSIWKEQVVKSDT